MASAVRGDRVTLVRDASYPFGVGVGTVGKKEERAGLTVFGEDVEQCWGGVRMGAVVEGEMRRGATRAGEYAGKQQRREPGGQVGVQAEDGGHRVR